MSAFVRFVFILLITCGPALADPEPEATSFVQIESLADLDRYLKSENGGPTIVRVRADWNISSAELDKHFASETLQHLLADVVLLEIDVTDNTDDHREFLSKYGIFGVPHFLFFDKSGTHIVGKDLAGYHTAPGLEKHIRDALSIGKSPSPGER